MEQMICHFRVVKQRPIVKTGEEEQEEPIVKTGASYLCVNPAWIGDLIKNYWRGEEEEWMGGGGWMDEVGEEEIEKQLKNNGNALGREWIHRWKHLSKRKNFTLRLSSHEMAARPNILKRKKSNN